MPKKLDAPRSRPAARGGGRIARYYDLRRGKAGRRRQSPRPPDMALVERALDAVARSDSHAPPYEYAPIEVSTTRGPRRLRVVDLQQRHWGFPVYDGRRRVLFDARRALQKVTGKPIAVGVLRGLTPRASAEKAVRAAVARVLSSAPTTDLQLLAPITGREAAAFRWKGLESPITAHLSVFVADATRLAWVVSFGAPNGLRHEVLVDAHSLRLLKRRTLSYHLDACLNLGVPGSLASTSLGFDPAWRRPQSRRLVCTYADEPWDRQPSPSGLICGTGVADKRSLNTLSLASRGLELLDSAGARMGTPTGRKLEGRVYGRVVDDPATAALAASDYFRLSGLDAGHGHRHAAYDPTIVLHEMSHIVLSVNLGGTAYPAPFEAFGESGAVAEGLADFLGLTLWNRIRREATPLLPETWVVGASFLPESRDYTGYWRSSPVAVSGGGGSIHAQGMRLCGALVFALFQLIAAGETRSDAERALWRAVCVGLQSTPHQNELPLFCCLRKAITATIEPGLRAPVDGAFRKVRLSDRCSH